MIIFIINDLYFETNEKKLFIDKTTGNIGIETTKPDEKFEIEWINNRDVEIGRGTTDLDITFISLRDSNGIK